MRAPAPGSSTPARERVERLDLAQVAAAPLDGDVALRLEAPAEVARVAGQRGEHLVGDAHRLPRRAREGEDLREHRGHPGPGRRVGERRVGLAQVPDGGRAVHEHLREPEIEQHGRAPLLGRRLGQRAGEQPDRRVRRAAGEGRAAGLVQQRGDVAVALRRDGEQLRGDLVGRRPERLEDPHRALVPQRALPERQLAVDGVAHERVHEAQRRVRAQDLRAGEDGGGAGQRGLVDLGQRRDRGQARALAQDGHRAGDRERLGRLPGEPQEHRPRHRARPDLAHDPGARRVRPHAFGLQRAQAAGGSAAGCPPVAACTAAVKDGSASGPSDARTRSSTAVPVSGPGRTGEVARSAAISPTSAGSVPGSVLRAVTASRIGSPSSRRVR